LRREALTENLELLKSQVKEVKEIAPEMAKQSSIMRDQNNHTLAQLEHFERLAILMGEELPADAQKMLDLFRAMSLETPKLPEDFIESGVAFVEPILKVLFSTHNFP